MSNNIPKQTFLILEDDSIIRESFRRYITKHGHEVVGEATSGQEMVDLAIKFKPNFILFDFNVAPPIPNGLDALEEIYKHINPRDIMAIAITGSESPEDMDRASRDFVLSYLIKPVTEMQLMAAVRTVYANYQRNRVEIEKLKTDLNEAKIVNQAKHLLMKKLGWGEEKSFQYIRRNAMNKGIKMTASAEQVISQYL